MVQASPSAGPIQVDDPTFTAAAAELRGFKFVRDLQLGDGRGIKAKWMGFGKPVELADPNTGEVRAVSCAMLETGNVTYRLLCGVKLERLLGAIEVGKTVAILRLGQVEIKGGKRMTDYAVGSE
jgi:hypothetical protein